MFLTRPISTPFFTAFGDRFRIAGCLQATILLLSSTVLDGGELLQFMMICAVAYWCAVALILIRRNGNATAWDRFLIAWGYPLAMPLVMAVSFFVPTGLLRHG